MTTTTAAAGTAQSHFTANPARINRLALFSTSNRARPVVIEASTETCSNALPDPLPAARWRC